MLRAIVNTLNRMGGRNYEVFRQEKDLNGQPIGEIKSVGKLFGLCYRDDYYRRGGVKIDLPGMTERIDERPMLGCIKVCGEKPKKEDIIKGCDTESRVISTREDGVLITITLENMI